MVEESDGYHFWRDVLGSPRQILAPMVEQSELPWRLLSRRYGAQLCYTPMLHASVFTKDARYRKENLATCEEDRPLIVQFCANTVETFVEAALIAQDFCDAIDLNLGCPQTIAQRGHYGAFLEDEWELLSSMVRAATSRLKVPITCKVRIFSSIEKTISYAKMLEAAGCKILTVHGRTKEQKGAHTGLASWEHIRAVKANVKIPVFANGNIQYQRDVGKCMKQTGADGVMIAEGNLYNPALFTGKLLPFWELALEYLQLVLQYPCLLSNVRGHLFKLCHFPLVEADNHDVRQRIASGKDVTEFISAVEELKRRYEMANDCYQRENSDSNNPPPMWICRPYVRPPPKPIGSGCVEEKRKADDDSCCLSKQQFKKLMKRANKKSTEKVLFEKCVSCHNPKGLKCDLNLCRTCCKQKTSCEQLDCYGHKFMFMTKAEIRKNSMPIETGCDVRKLCDS